MYRVIDEVLANDLELGDEFENDGGPVLVLSLEDGTGDAEDIIFVTVCNEKDDEYEITMSYDEKCELMMDIRDDEDEDI